MKRLSLLLSLCLTTGLHATDNNQELCETGKQKIFQALTKYNTDFDAKLTVNDYSLKTLVNEEYLKNLPSTPVGGYFFSNEANEIQCSFDLKAKELPTKFDELYKEEEQGFVTNGFLDIGSPKPTHVTNQQVNKAIRLATSFKYIEQRDRSLKKFASKYVNAMNPDQLISLASHGYYIESRESILKKGLNANVSSYSVADAIRISNRSYYPETNDHLLKYYARKNKTVLSFNDLMNLARGCKYTGSYKSITKMAQKKL